MQKTASTAGKASQHSDVSTTAEPVVRYLMLDARTLCLGDHSANPERSGYAYHARR